jgi:hypothetical protein
VVVNPPAFELTLTHAAPPPTVSAALQALWWAKKGEWDKAHRLVMETSGADAAWVHAYLHRVEGDLGNAGYWYRQAGQPVAKTALDAEWAAIVQSLLHTNAKQTT